MYLWNNTACREAALPEMSDTNWENKNSISNTEVQVESFKLPVITNKEKEQVLRMYWLDAYEDCYKQPGKYDYKLSLSSSDKSN